MAGGVDVLPLPSRYLTAPSREPTVSVRIGASSTALCDDVPDWDELWLGCFGVERLQVEATAVLTMSNMSLDRCSTACKGNGSAAIGVRGDSCFCLRKQLVESDTLDDHLCNTVCIGDESQLCGGFSAQRTGPHSVPYHLYPVSAYRTLHNLPDSSYTVAGAGSDEWNGVYLLKNLTGSLKGEALRFDLDVEHSLLRRRGVWQLAHFEGDVAYQTQMTTHPSVTPPDGVWVTRSGEAPTPTVISNGLAPSCAFRLEPAAAPVVVSVTPSAAHTNSTIIISGSGFRPSGLPPVVTVCGLTCPLVEFSESSISCLMPPCSAAHDQPVHVSLPPSGAAVVATSAIVRGILDVTTVALAGLREVAPAVDYSSMQFDDDSLREAANAWLRPETRRETEEAHGPISTWDVSQVLDMSYLFAARLSFNEDLNAWDVFSVTDMTGMFSGCKSFDGPLDGWDVSKVRVMSNMFTQAASFTGVSIWGWEIGRVTSLKYTFHGAALFSGDLSAWNVSQVIDLSYAFAHAWAFDSDISCWDVSRVVDMRGMLLNAGEKAPLPYQAFRPSLFTQVKKLPSHTKHPTLPFLHRQL